MLKIKNKRLFKAVFSVFMVVVICLATMGSVPIKVYSAYIDPALEKVLSRAEDTELIPVDIWLYDIDTEEVDEKVFAKTGLSRETISDEKRSADLTHEQVDAYIEAERTFYAEAQTKRSNEFLKQYSNIFTSKATENSEVFYVSKYAPSIQMELTPAQIAKLAKDLSVESMYYSPLQYGENLSNHSIPNIRADYSRDNLGYTGSGIRIGMIESELPEKTKSYFNSSKIIYDPTIDTTARYQSDVVHANLVASIIVGQESSVDGNVYEGIVPDATLYASKCYTGVELRDGVEWLLSQYVNVINVSWSLDNHTGVVGALDKWFDHIAINHSVHVVLAAGNYHETNNPNNYVSSPGLSYNAITVGNINDKNNTVYSDDEISSNSSYLEVGNSTKSRKPDLVAPGTNIKTPAGEGSGTSFAAPHVAAIVAQLCQAKPALKTQQDAMKAILTASINHSAHHYEPSDVNYDKYGAGVVDARSSLYTASNSRYATSSFSATAENDSSHYYNFTVTSSDTKIRISLAWLKYAYISASSHPESTPTPTVLSDLDLLIYNSSGTCVYASNVAAGNVEIVEMHTFSPGTYTIEVNLFDNGGTKTYYTVAWW